MQCRTACEKQRILGSQLSSVIFCQFFGACRFHYFSMNDLDKDNRVDGIEILKALTHTHDPTLGSWRLATLLVKLLLTSRDGHLYFVLNGFWITSCSSYSRPNSNRRRTDHHDRCCFERYGSGRRRLHWLRWIPEEANIVTTRVASPLLSFVLSSLSTCA